MSTLNPNSTSGEERRIPWRWVGIAIVSVVIFVIVVQNTEVVTVKLLFWDFTMSRVILIIFSAACGFIAGWLFARLFERRRRRSATGQ